MQSRLWLETYGYPALHRLNKMAKGLITFGILDVAAAFAWCGYESVTLASRNSSFCSTDLFTEHVSLPGGSAAYPKRPVS